MSRVYVTPFSLLRPEEAFEFIQMSSLRIPVPVPVFLSGPGVIVDHHHVPSAAVFPTTTAAMTSRGPPCVNETLTSVMECPVCFDITLPILQCQNGHIICETCLNSLASKICPTCRVSCAVPSRNLALEKVVKDVELRYSCKYAGSGCEQRMSFMEKIAHQKICPFKSYPCPLASNGCKWEGAITHILPHLSGRVHSIPVIYGVNESHNFFTQRPTDQQSESGIYMIGRIQFCFDATFLILLSVNVINKVTEDDSVELDYEYAAVVQCVGPSELSRQFAYRLELELDGKRLSWEAVPLSINKSVRATLGKGDCLVFGSKTMNLFRNQDSDALPLNVTINKI